MDLFSLGFLLLILVASGVVAFLADRLGKKLGKKRLSIWGLRPKHVAALGTVVMGVVVSGLTIALVAAASSDARTWLKEGRQLLIQRERLEKENKDLGSVKEQLSQDIQEFSEANERLRKSNQDFQKKLVDLQKKFQSERERLVKTQKQREELEATTVRLKSEAARLETHAASLLRQVASLGRNLRKTKADLAASRKVLAQNQAALKQARVALNTYQARISQSRRELDTSEKNRQAAYTNWQDALVKSRETYLELKKAEAEIETAKTRIADLTTEREKAEKYLETAQKQYASTQAQLDQAQKDLVDVIAQVRSQQGFLNSAIRNARTEPMTFRAREEVARFVVPGGADASLSRAALSSLIRLARLTAADRGAKGGKSNGQTFEVADIFDRQDPKTKTVISSDELKDAVVSRAAGRVEDQVLVATSSFNAFAGEPVSLDISVLPNPLIYHRGEMLSEARIDGSLPEDEIYGQISEFVRSRVRERATQDRMIPRTGTDAPFGVVSQADVFALLRDVKRVGRAVRVQAFAGDDIHAADPLRLEFRLK